MEHVGSVKMTVKAAIRRLAVVLGVPAATVLPAAADNGVLKVSSFPSGAAVATGALALRMPHAVFCMRSRATREAGRQALRRQ